MKVYCSSSIQSSHHEEHRALLGMSGQGASEPSDARRSISWRRLPVLSQRDAFKSALVRRNEGGSILIIVLWVAFGLIALTLYFANSMSFELRASDNRASSIEADEAIAGAARYVSNVLATVKEPATLPDINNYRSEAVPVGDATFWIIGRSDRSTAADQVRLS